MVRGEDKIGENSASMNRGDTFDSLPQYNSAGTHNDIETITSATPNHPRYPPPSSYDKEAGFTVHIDPKCDPYTSQTPPDCQHTRYDHDHIPPKPANTITKNVTNHTNRLHLLRSGLAGLTKTILLSLAIGLSLRAYQGFRTPLILSTNGVRSFNAIMLGLSLMLGLNLASSLKRCATILRWSILTKRYVDLEVFDLLLGVETLTKVMKLMVISIPGLHRLNCMRSVPWFRDARKDATKWTSVLCLLWLLVNLGAQILVASLSLFWPVDPSQGTPLLTYGNVSVADLTTWKQHDRAALPWEMSEGEVEAAYNLMSMEAAWSYGFTATRYPVFAVGDVQRDLSSVAGTPLYAGDGFYEYRFINRNPEHLFTEYLIGSRTVQARAACTRLETKGGYFREESDNLLYVEARYPGGPWKRHHLPEVVDGSITWIAHFTVDCGPRCTSLTVFQNSDIATITHNSLFQCNSTLLPVTGGEQDFTNLNEDERTHIYGTDEWATIAAGSIAWTGTISEQDNYTLNARSYLRGSEWSPYHIVSATEVEKLLARYAIGAVAAFDDHGLRFSVKGQFTKPVLGQQLNVDWIWVLSLLGAICGIQFAALVALLVLANKAIIRDDSFVSLAMLLRPIVNRIGEEGMGLSGEEIKEHPKLKFKRVRYGYREGDKGEPKQVDIFFEGKDTLEGKERWTPGLYN